MERTRGNMVDFAAFKAYRQPVLGDGTYGHPIPIQTKPVFNNEPIPIEVGRKKYLRDGSEINTKSLNPINLDATPSETSKHEMKHAGVAIKLGVGVETVTRIPNYDEGYEGVTILESTSLNPGTFATIAIASHANGHVEGAGSDRMKAELSGADVHAASNAARSIASQNKDEFHAAACALEERGTLTGGEIIEIMDRVRRGDDVEVKIKYPNGETKTKIINGVKGDTIMVPGEIVSIESAKDKDHSQEKSNISQFPTSPSENVAIAA